MQNLLEQSTLLDIAQNNVADKGQLLNLEQVFVASPVPILITDSDAKVIYANPAWEKSTGYTLDEVTGRNPRFLNSGKTPKRVHKRMWQTLKRGQAFTTEEVIDRRKDGSFFQIQSTVFPLIRNDKPVYYFQIYQDITERKKSEEAKSLLALIIKYSRDAIVGLSPSGIITTWNSAAAKLYGYTDKDMVGAPVSKLFPLKNGTNKEKKIFERLKQSKKALFYETKRKHKNGKIIDVSISLSPIKNNDKLVGFSEIGRDVTHQKVAGQIIAEREKEYRCLFEKNPNPMWIYDMNTLKFLAVNYSAVKKYKYSKKEFLHMSIKDIRPPHDVPVFLNHLKKLRSKKPKIEHLDDRIHMKKDGTRINVEITRSPITFQSKDAVLVLSLDITNRKKTERKLMESEERMRKIIEWANDPILLIDEGTDRIIEANRKASEILGIPKKKLIGMQHLKIHPREVWEDHSQQMRSSVEKRSLTYETLIKTRKGVINAEVSSNVLDIDGKKLIQNIIRDITERKRVEDMKTEFLSVASHELKTPITTLKLVTENLTKSANTEEARHLNIINKEIDRLTKLINELLDVSRVDTQRLYLNFEIIDLTSFVADVNKKLKLIYKDKRIVFVKSNKIEAIADPYRIEQVLANLIGNACKHSGEDSPIYVSAKRQGKFALIRVNDNGIGIDKEKQKHIFERFYQIKEHSTNGFGLGLYISKKIVEEHKGKIWVESQKGKGSSFYFTLPLAG